MEEKKYITVCSEGRKWDQMTALQKLMFLFHLKSSFHSRDIQFLIFLLSPLFLPVSHCFRGWSKINLIVYDIINILNKMLITHFIWYLEKEKRYDTETLSVDTELNKEQFYGKIMQKMCTKSYSQTQSFPYQNHCECYKKLASRSWSVLFTLTYFFLIHTLSPSAGKVVTHCL